MNDEQHAAFHLKEYPSHFHTTRLAPFIHSFYLQDNNNYDTQTRKDAVIYSQNVE